MAAQKWSLFKEDGKWVIRRWEDGKYKRLPLKRYALIRDNPEELRQFLLRLNAEHRCREAVAFKHAFIDDPLLSEYEEWLLAQIPTARNARCEFKYLKTYFLNYFIGALDLANPLDWHRVHDTKWAKYLLSDEAPSSVQTKRAIVQSANRFMGWLHKRRPAEVPPLVFAPVSKASFKAVQAQRELDDDVRDRKVITDADLEIILKRAGPDLLPFIQLGLNYGLRRAEALGVAPGDVKKGCLSVERQLVTVTPAPKHGPLKGRSERKVPHWFAKAAQAYKWVDLAKAALVHPDTLSDRWRAFIDALLKSTDNANLSQAYDFHDLRHTFITKAMAAQPIPRDVQLAAGHKNIETTMKYAHDVRKLDDEEFKPGAA